MTQDHLAHPTVTVIIDGQPTLIDVDLAPLITALTARGILTVGCCQGGPGERADIGFDDPAAVIAFLELVARVFRTDIDGLWNRIFYCDEPDANLATFQAERLWEFYVRPLDRSVDQRSLTRSGGPDVHLLFTITFPPDDIAAITWFVR